ncbi:cytochrome P450 [Lysinibacillus yapensis]|uniref:Cytochrome P450 n=1 Tax=Ureibacillus yapensis TaxID=2304605 RepID=A0A396SBY2_9BACL|nr:cytochrome P450 [Lysinibacillus yapensis]RHW34978.1 cytochrome P450 [Lysinibacillus yapensis]
MENRMPREEGIDHSISLLKEGYQFILNRSEQFDSNVFETRILGRKAICMIGEEAAQIFYDPSKFKRNGAAPNRVKETLFGENSVQTLDDEEHRNRKAMLMSVMTPEKLESMIELTKMQWEKSLDQWSKMNSILFYEEVKELLCEVAFKWIGYPLNEQHVPKMTKELSAMFETAAVVGPNHWMGRALRNNVEKTIHQLIIDMREDKLKISKDTVLHQFAFHKDANGHLLDEKTVTVEIINMLRPIVAISIYINFSLLALLQFPEQKEKLKTFPDYSKMFVQEVRRFYPFFPFVAAKVKQDFTWNGYQFAEGTLTLLDLYGTNHDPVKWEDPYVFNPERFAHWKGTPFSFIPQGGGDYYLGHRCAGEQITIDVMKVSLDFLVNRMEYNVPEQDLNFSLDDIPSIPQSKIILDQVKRSRSHS